MLLGVLLGAVEVLGRAVVLLDEDGAFRAKVNPAMLDQLEELSDADADAVRALVEEHTRRTGSPVGARVLERFD